MSSGRRRGAACLQAPQQPTAALNTHPLHFIEAGQHVGQQHLARLVDCRTQVAGSSRGAALMAARGQRQERALRWAIQLSPPPRQVTTQPPNQTNQPSNCGCNPAPAMARFMAGGTASTGIASISCFAFWRSAWAGGQGGQEEAAGVNGGAAGGREIEAELLMMPTTATQPQPEQPPDAATPTTSSQHQPTTTSSKTAPSSPRRTGSPPAPQTPGPHQ